MKKIIRNIFATLVLCSIALTAVCSVSGAKSLDGVNYSGTRVRSVQGYRSYTEASSYASNGVPLNIGVRASLGGTTAKTLYGAGNVEVYSKYSGYAYDAQHWVCKGHNMNIYLDYWVYNY